MEELKKMMQDGVNYFENIFLEIEKVSLHLKAKEKELEKREKQLLHREAQIETQSNKLQHHWKMVGAKKLECNTGALQMMKEFQRDLREMKEALNQMEQVNKAKNSISNDELQEARNLLIKILREGKTGATIGVKKMGGLDIKPFRTAMKRKFPGEAEEKAVEMCAVWENYLRDSTSHPFKIIVNGKGKCKKILDTENNTLKFLKEECNEEAFKAVTRALTEMDEYNLTGGYTKLELWNFRKNREATLREGILYTLKMWKGQRQKTK